MGIETKSEYDLAYSSRALVPNGKGGFARSTVRLHYHRAAMEGTVKARWDRIVPILSITSADKVVIVGAGFGWAVERLIEITGCQAIGIDISDYIDSEKSNTEEVEIDAAIVAANLDPLSGPGLAVKNAVFTGEPRAKEKILKNSLSTNKMRNDVKKEFGNSEPTWIITEDMITELTDAEITAWVSEANKLQTAQICHVLRESYPPNSKTAEEWNTFTSHIIIALGSYKMVP